MRSVFSRARDATFVKVPPQMMGGLRAPYSKLFAPVKLISNPISTLPPSSLLVYPDPRLLISLAPWRRRRAPALYIDMPAMPGASRFAPSL
eukprot:2433791-Prymnesium_polylepis.1